MLAREKCTSLAELFSIELKFTIDTLNDWFNSTIKPKFFEIDSLIKMDWRQKNSVTYQTKCTICDFPLAAEAKNGWFEHVVKAEHLFLKNIYSNEEMKKIVGIESHKEIIYCLFDLHSYFEVARQDGVITDEIRDFILEDLSGCYETFQDLRKDIENIVIPEHPWSRKSFNFSEKIIASLDSNMISFCRTEKLKDIPLSKKFISNIKNVMENTHCIHHSHVSGHIIGYSHTFSNEKVREHYYRVPVTAHNLFRLFSLFFAKRI